MSTTRPAIRCQAWPSHVPSSFLQSHSRIWCFYNTCFTGRGRWTVCCQGDSVHLMKTPPVSRVLWNHFIEKTNRVQEFEGRIWVEYSTPLQYHKQAGSLCCSWFVKLWFFWLLVKQIPIQVCSIIFCLFQVIFTFYHGKSTKKPPLWAICFIFPTTKQANLSLISHGGI